ncbi:MAG: chalcone isomerase family protein [Deltaproteobacteria bacterium]|nr:chalcone isomerase family protein [Deltaproteobacteria bacterium]
MRQGRTTKADTGFASATGETFALHPEYDGQRYSVLGTGVRAMQFTNVYAIGFHLEDLEGMRALTGYFEGAGAKHRSLRGIELARALERDAGFFAMLMDSPFGKAAELVFRQPVKAEQMRQAFTRGLRRTLAETEMPRIEKVVGLLKRDLAQGDRLLVRTRANRTVVLDFDGAHHEIEDELLARATWVPYLGVDSVTPSLKECIALRVADMRGPR